VSPPLGWADEDGKAHEGTPAARLLQELARLQDPPLSLVVSLDWCRLRDSLDGEGLIIEVDKSNRETRVDRCPYIRPSQSPVRRSAVFICYRREDSAGHVGRLQDYLQRKHFSVFRDLDAITPGADFRAVCQAEIRKCDAQLVVIGRHWVTAQGPRGRRLDDPTDLVRQEIEIGLSIDIRVIPVLVDGATMPSRAELPPSITELTSLNALELPNQWWDAAAQMLAKTLNMNLS
jgi:TIR domain